jgi:hypothetical protein
MSTTKNAPKKVVIKKTAKQADKASKSAKAKKQVKSAPQTGNTTYKRGTLGKAIYGYFDACKAKKAEPNYDEALAIAQKSMPETKFNKFHYSWYKNKWNLRQETPKTEKK